MINIIIERNIEDDLFDGADDHAARCYEKIHDKHEVTTGRTIDDLVADYDRVVQIAHETILNYFRNYRKIYKYIGCN